MLFDKNWIISLSITSSSRSMIPFTFLKSTYWVNNPSLLAGIESICWNIHELSFLHSLLSVMEDTHSNFTFIFRKSKKARKFVPLVTLLCFSYAYEIFKHLLWKKSTCELCWLFMDPYIKIITLDSINLSKSSCFYYISCYTYFWIAVVFMSFFPVKSSRLWHIGTPITSTNF